LLKMGDFVFPLIPRIKEHQELANLVIESVGEFSVCPAKCWQESVTRGTALANHEDLACLFSALRFLDAFHTKKTSEYGLSRWPHGCIDHFTANVATRFPFVINRQTMARLVYIPMREAGLHKESSLLKRSSFGCTVIESNPSMILRISFFVNAFQESKPWGPESSHIVLGGGRRAGAVLAWITRCLMTIIHVDKSDIAHEEAIRAVNEYRLFAKIDPRVVNELRDTAEFTAEDLKGLTSASRFVGSTKSNQLGNIDKLVFESEFMTVYWTCHVSAAEFKRLGDEFGMDAKLADGWILVILTKLRQEKTGMTVYLWLRRLPNKMMLRSPQLVKWRLAALEIGVTEPAAKEMGDTARAVNNLTADLKPDESAFVRRSGRKTKSTLTPSASPDNLLISSPELVSPPNPIKKTTPRAKKTTPLAKKQQTKPKGTPKSASVITPPSGRKRISKSATVITPQLGRKRIGDPRASNSGPKVRQEGKSDERKEVPVASPSLVASGKRKAQPAAQVTAPTHLKDTPKLPNLALATVVHEQVEFPQHSKELLNRLAEQANLLTMMQARESERESQRKIEHSQLLASLHSAHSLPVNPPSAAVPEHSLPAVIPVAVIERFETQAKNINDALLTIQKNQTPDPLAMKQMEMIAALNRGNEKTALERKIRKEAKKKAKRKALKDKKIHQETKARWHAKRAKTELGAAAGAAQVLAAVQQTLHIPSRSNEISSHKCSRSPSGVSKSSAETTFGRAAVVDPEVF
jgi:hypothetical protein